MKIINYPSLLLIVFVSSCSLNSKKQSKLVWSKNYSVIGSQSSPRTEDINKDGTLDIIMGAGKNEFQQSDMGIVAFDGKSGNLIWKQEAPDQVFGSASFCDVNGDSIGDVFIGGRSPQLKAIDGRTGRLLWEFRSDKYKDDPILKYARFNFNNSVIVPDQNNDGINDLLTVNGGNAFANPFQTRNRFPGVLMLLDTKTGDVIAADTMPDGKESYMTPLCFAQPGSKELNILFGTGGETINGSLYISDMSHLKSKKLSESIVIATESGHGFIAPASLADITGDGYLDIIAISHGSKAVAIDGKDYHLLWSKSFPGTECSNSFAVGYFTDDNVPDFFTFISKGEWPNSSGSVQIMLNGENGNVEFTDSIGCTGFSTPVVYDLNNDGRDEALISVNDFDCSLGYASKSPDTMTNRLLSIDFRKKSIMPIVETQGFKNIFSTPWIGDLDNDGYLDIIYCQYYHHRDLLAFLGMTVKRIDTPVKMRKKVWWGSFLGSAYNGIFAPK
ncbi:MAG TPA: PQQ-binding-like beta-propeller repeat protein [Flavitalea sp.]|nr:PQQ-binding-like beta-propeller repeat protein [Flavitalea sp.]